MGSPGARRPWHPPTRSRRLAPFRLGLIVRHEPDVSVADWFINAGAPWNHLAVQGPPGFDAYASVWFDEGEAEPPRDDNEIYRLVVDVAAKHTSTPDEATFGLWEGDGAINGGLMVTVHESGEPSVAEELPNAFDASIMTGPKADLDGFRAYILFVGALADFGNWPVQPGPDGYLPEPFPPAIAWPADRAWFIADDTDPCALTVGGSQALIDDVLAHPNLHARQATYGQMPSDDCADR